MRGIVLNLEFSVPAVTGLPARGRLGSRSSLPPATLRRRATLGPRPTHRLPALHHLEHAQPNNEKACARPAT